MVCNVLRSLLARFRKELNLSVCWVWRRRNKVEATLRWLRVMNIPSCLTLPCYRNSSPCGPCRCTRGKRGYGRCVRSPPASTSKRISLSPRSLFAPFACSVVRAVLQLLRVEPSDRMTLVEAMEHPWLRPQAAAAAVADRSEVSAVERPAVTAAERA